MWFNTRIMLRNLPSSPNFFVLRDSIIKLKTEISKSAYSELSQIFKMELLHQKSEWLKALNYFHKKLHQFKSLWATLSESGISQQVWSCGRSIHPQTTMKFLRGEKVVERSLSKVCFWANCDGQSQWETFEVRLLLLL